jgi:acyl-CoA hydrolase
MNPKTVSSTRTETSQVITPGDANFLGKVFGGAILSLIDLCAYATASRFAGNIAVTASFDRVDFLEPIEIGEVVSCVGHVTYVGRTSMEVTIEVSAENVLKGNRRQTNTARVTLVALKDNKPVEVPRLICETRQEKIAFLEGRLRRELRQLLDRRREELAKRLQGLSDAELEQSMNNPDFLSRLALGKE